MLCTILLIGLMGFCHAEQFVANYLNKKVVTGVCPFGFQNIDDICYYFSKVNNRDAVTWDTANKTCTGMSNDGYKVGLAEMNFAETWRSDGMMLEKIAKTKWAAWLGGMYVINQWYWVNSGRGLSTTDSAWKPTVQSPEDGKCLMGYIVQDVQRVYLNNARCNQQDTKNQYVCQLF